MMLAVYAKLLVLPHKNYPIPGNSTKNFYIYTQINNTITKGPLANPQQRCQKNLLHTKLYDASCVCQTSGTATQEQFSPR